MDHLDSLSLTITRFCFESEINGVLIRVNLGGGTILPKRDGWTVLVCGECENV